MKGRCFDVKVHSQPLAACYSHHLGRYFYRLFHFDPDARTPAEIILGSDASEEEIHALNDELGFYDPLIVRYFNYLKGVLSFDFGESYLSPTPCLCGAGQEIPIYAETGHCLHCSVSHDRNSIGRDFCHQTVFFHGYLADGWCTDPGVYTWLCSGTFNGVGLFFEAGVAATEWHGSLKHYIMPVLTLSLSSRRS